MTKKTYLTYKLFINLYDNSFEEDRNLSHEIHSLLSDNFGTDDNYQDYIIAISAYIIIPEIDKNNKDKYLIKNKNKNKNDSEDEFLNSIKFSFMNFYDHISKIQNNKHYSKARNTKINKEIWNHSIEIKKCIDNTKVVYDYNKTISEACKFFDCNDSNVKAVLAGKVRFLSPSELTENLINNDRGGKFYIDCEEEDLAKLLPPKQAKIRKNIQAKDEKQRQEKEKKNILPERFRQ